jgi:hypothetical protein
MATSTSTSTASAPGGYHQPAMETTKELAAYFRDMLISRVERWTVGPQRYAGADQSFFVHRSPEGRAFKITVEELHFEDSLTIDTDEVATDEAGTDEAGTPPPVDDGAFGYVWGEDVRS